MNERPVTEVWFRNPGFYGRQLAEVGALNVVFDHAYMAYRKWTPAGWCRNVYGAAAKWRCLVIDTEYSPLYESWSRDPVAVFPTWRAATQGFKRLLDLIEKPVSERKHPDGLKLEHRPVPEQAHIVVVTDLPDLRVATTRTFIEDLAQIQEDYPEVTLMLHGLYSFRVMFGKTFKWVDADPYTMARKGEIWHPGGAHIKPEALVNASYWAELMGHKIGALCQEGSERCLFNIKSTLFASVYFKKLERFAVKKPLRRGINPRTEPEWNTPQMEDHLKRNSIIFTKRLVSQPGDRVVCDDCSLWLSCKFYREGQVCVVPDSEMKKVADLFGTRDSENIQKGLQAILAVNVGRIEKGVEDERDSEEGGIDPNLTKLIGETFKMGHEFLKIVDPAMRAGKPAVNVNVGVGGSTPTVSITQGDEREMISAVYNMLEARGYRRDDITEEMVRSEIQSLYDKERANKAITSTAEVTGG